MTAFDMGSEVRILPGALSDIRVKIERPLLAQSGPLERVILPVFNVRFTPESRHSLNTYPGG